MAIEITGLRDLLDKAGSSSLTIGNYYYTVDVGRLYQATATNKYNLMSNVYYVASDFDRRNNVARIMGKYYYCLDLNQLWLFNNLSMWEYIDGDNRTISYYTNTNFSDGNFLFAQTRKVTLSQSEVYSITTTLQKINGMVFGSFKISGTLPADGVLAEIPVDWRPLSGDKTVYIVGENNGVPELIKSKLYITGQQTQGKLILNDASHRTRLSNSSYFMYALDDTPAAEITNV